MGATGTYGPINITADTTLLVPVDGVFQVTTLTVASGATLRFTPNARNTAITIVATGNVTINGTIDISGSPGVAGSAGAGGPGGGSGAPPALFQDRRSFDPFFPRAGDRTYGGVGGAGSYANLGTSCTLLGSGGGGGGGAIIIISNTRIQATQAGATIDASGKSASSVRPTNPMNMSLCAGQVASGGRDGRIGLSAPTIETPSLTLIGANFKLEGINLIGSPPQARSSSFLPSALGLDPTLEAFVPNNLTARIVSVDGTAFPVGTESVTFTLPTAATSATVVTTVAGCPVGSLTVNLLVYGFFFSCVGDTTTFQNATTATTTWTCPLRTTSGPIGGIFLKASCQ